MKRLNLMLVVLLAGMPALTVFAQDQPTTDKRYAELDADGDGAVTRAEFKLAAGEIQNPAVWWGLYIAFVAADTDDDLLMSKPEFIAYITDESTSTKHLLYQADQQAALDEIWPELDTDENDKVTEGEWGECLNDTSEFVPADKNNNGVISREELWIFIKAKLSGQYEFLDNAEIVANSDDEFLGDRKDYPLYVTDREWKHKTTLVPPGGVESTGFTSWRVSEVSNERARCRMRIMDAEQRVTFSSYPEIRFMKKSPAPATTAEPVKETLTVTAGEFECTLTETTLAGVTCKVWISTKYPGLLVKSETTGNISATTELVEFKP